MKTTRLIGSVAVILAASILLGACDEGSNNSTSSATTTNQASSSSSQREPFVWPGKNNKATVSSNLTASNYMIVYDGSGSMSDSAPTCGINTSKHQEGLKAVKEFVKAIPSDANIGLYVFDRNGEGVRVPLGLDTVNRDKVLQGLNDVRPGSGTPLGDSLKAGYKVLTLQAQKQLGYGRYSLVVVTDGAADSASYLAKMVNYIVDNSPIEIHAIGFCLGEGHTLNQKGRTFYTSAQSPEDLLKSLKGVLAETNDADTEFSK